MLPFPNSTIVPFLHMIQYAASPIRIPIYSPISPKKCTSAQMITTSIRTDIFIAKGGVYVTFSFFISIPRFFHAKANSSDLFFIMQ